MFKLTTPLLILGLCLPALAQASNTQLPKAYIEFGQMAEELIAPLVPLMDSERSNFFMEGLPSDHGIMADELEAFTRPTLLLALWLQMEPLPDEARAHSFTKEEVAAWFRAALLNGTDEEHPAYWGHLLNYHQHGVEMSILTMSLTVAREWVWDPLTTDEQAQVLEWLGEIRGNARYWNNHIFFSILTIEFLRSVGDEQPGDQASIDYMFELLESMHLGGGWFKDGTNESFDHYNAYAFHTYGLWWSWKYGHTNPERAERWRAWSTQFIPDYTHFFSATGEHLPYGRSITYRFNSLGVFGLAPQVGLEAVPYGEMRRISRKNLEFFLSSPITQSQGLLSVGWSDQFQAVAEPYTCPGSPYWAAKGLFVLSIPPEHAFWSAPEQPYPAERGDFSRVIGAPRFVLEGVGGEVQLLNAGSQVSRGGGARYGHWKWSKLSYRTGLGFLVAEDFTQYPVDAQLTVSPEGFDFRYGRRATLPVVAKDGHVAFVYALGNRSDEAQFNAPVRSDVYTNGEWVLAVHRVKSFVPAEFFQGSFALGSDSPDFEKSTSGDNYALVSSDEGGVSIQGIAGYSSTIWDERLDESTSRLHLTKDYHVTPVLQAEMATGERILAALYWAGRDEGNGQPWEVVTTDEGDWKFHHPVLGGWHVQDANLPELAH